MQSLATVIGVIAATGTATCWLPQVLKTVKTRSAEDFSWIYLAMLLSGTALWIVYGLLQKDAIVVGANVVTLVLVLVVTGVKFREKAG
jgi:MtN3 and saliva related transmembrane protein